MPSNLNLDYYYGNEAGQYSFYRIPKALLTDPHFKSISVEAKVLYGLMLDRMGLSIRNGWLDGDGKVYIYFTQEEAMSILNCGKDKATKLFRELDKGGIGLIERKKQGQGKPTRIYVKSFVLPNQVQDAASSAQTAENQPSDRYPTLWPTEKRSSRPPENRGQENEISVPNKTDQKKTDLNQTDLSILPPAPTPPASQPRRIGMDEMERYRARLKENIAYDLLVTQKPDDQELLDGYLELMVEVCCTKRESIRICGQDLAADVVKSRFLKLNEEHISYVIDSLKENTTQVRNIKAYMLAALYNAPVTMNQYYTAQANHDLQEFGG